VHVPVAQLDRDAAPDDQERLLLVVVPVPVGRADPLRDLEQVAVRGTDHPLGPELREPGGFSGEIDLLHRSSLAVSAGRRQW
jgi:hypothetical protein